MEPAHDITRQLTAWRKGDKAALDQVLPAVYAELRRLARSSLARERPGHTLQPTALVHEAYVKLIDQREVDWENRAHFLGIAAHVMRRILTQYAVRRRALKRGGGEAPTVDFGVTGKPLSPEDILLIHDALERLAEIDPQQARVVELRYFGGLTIEEAAEVLEISPATVKREWSMARAWLLRELHSGAA
jgi:RNA polymerase sigma factor (TIGR02999 family)